MPPYTEPQRPRSGQSLAGEGSGESSRIETLRPMEARSGKIVRRLALPMRSSTVVPNVPREICQRGSEHPVIAAFQNLQFAPFHPIIEADIEEQVIEIAAIILDKVNHWSRILQVLQKPQKLVNI